MIDDALRARIERFIDDAIDAPDPARRDALLAELSAHQAEHVSAYARFLASEPRRPNGLLPALPTDAFRYARVAAHDPSRDVAVFRTSGTTDAHRGQHALADLGLYDRAARAAAGHALFPDLARTDKRLRLIVLAPRAQELPDSSLSYMLQRFMTWFGDEHSVHVWKDGVLDIDALRTALRAASRAGEQVALLGTSFAFVHAEDALQDERFSLPRGSRIMQTGGFKGRSRSIEPSEMLALLSARYGVSTAFIVQEYGMTELSSQLYETTLRQAVLGEPIGERHLWVPGWVRATPIDPETLLPAADGGIGLLRIDDLANIHGVCLVQTSDLARRVEDGVVVLGRATGAIPRGCSIAVDEWLTSAP